MTPALQIPLEDELGDVLDKAMTCAGLTSEALAAASGVPASRIMDAVDYRPELTVDECRRIAKVLGLNEVGLCALATGSYPLPGADGLPFALWPLRMSYGIGVVNAYVVQGDTPGRGILFDAGPSAATLEAVWPLPVRTVEAVFVTHVETEHCGGVAWAAEHFGATRTYVPGMEPSALGEPLSEGQVLSFPGLEVTSYRTPGHSALHNCYHVRSTSVPGSRSLLVCGDLVFAGSAGGPYHCRRQLRDHLRRVLETVPPDTVLAPGHGPLTTAANELRYNPFVD